MIVRPRPRFFQLIFLLDGSILPRIAPQLVFMFAFSCVVVGISNLNVTPYSPAVIAFFKSIRNAPVTLLGIAISIFLGFRNNACYERWWEARRQLGQMVGEMRSLGRLATGCLEEPAHVVRPAIAFTLALMAQLRRKPLPPQVETYLGEEEFGRAGTSRNPANYILTIIAGAATRAFRAGEVSDILYARFDERISTLANIQVACERIATTPTPFTYTLLLHRTAYLFCFPLPIALAPTLGWATPFFCTLVAYTFFGLDALGDELEDPFGEHANTLPLDALARIIEVNLLETLGETVLPSYLQPVNHQLR